MQLFHYSVERYGTLKTKEKQGTVTEEDRQKAIQEHRDYYNKMGIDRPGFYFEHISFFFERPPLERMSKVFPSGHDFWFKGNRVFEHIVDSSSIGSFAFEIVEFPEKYDLYYNDNIDTATYIVKLKEATESLGYIGKGNKALELAVENNKLLNKTGYYYDLLKSRPNFDKIKNKYAATVPHVMLYPSTGIVRPFKIQQVVIG